MELRHTHILVPLQTWSTIKNNLAILEQKSPEVLAMSQKGCDVNEISGVVNNLMTTVNTNSGAFCTCESEAPDFGDAATVPNSNPFLLPQMQTDSIRSAPYLKRSGGMRSSSTNFTWWTNESWL